jgi:polysaccharide biosynthesis transport protein
MAALMIHGPHMLRDTPGKDAAVPHYPQKPMHVPQSNGLLEMREVWLLIQRQWMRFASVAALVTLCLVLAYLFYPFSYRATATLIMDPRPQNIAPGEPVQAGVGNDPAAIESQMQFMQSPDFVWSAIQNLRLAEDENFTRFITLTALDEGWKDALVHTFMRFMKVERVGLTYVISISYTDKSAQQAMRIANGIAQTYVEHLSTGQSALVRDAAQWLKERLFVMGRKLQASERAVDDFKRKNAFVAAGQGELQREKMVAALTVQLAQAESQMADAQSRLDALRQANARFSAGDAEVHSATLTNLRGQFASLARQHAETVAVYGERHPLFTTAQLQIQTLQSQINQEIVRLRQRVSQDYEVARKHVALLSLRLERAGKDNGVAVEFAALQREADADRKSYDEYSARERDLVNRQQLEDAGGVVLSHALLPSRPAKPKMPVAAAGIAFMALAVGVTAALFFDSMTMKTVRNSGQMRSLGISMNFFLPLFTSNSDRQTFHASLRYLLPPLRSAQTIVVTPIFGGEGASTVAASLASVLQGAGRKTLLLCMDSHRDISHEHKSGKVVQGVFAVRNFEQAIRRLPDGVECLSLSGLSGQAQGAHPFINDSLDEFIVTLRNRVDAIVIDAPPALALAGETSLLNDADKVLMVMEWGKTPLDKMAAGMELIAAAAEQGLVMGIINKADISALELYEQKYVA